MCTIAIRKVSPLGIPSDTSNPANQIVPVVPILAPKTQAIAAGRGTAPEATKAMIAVVLKLLDCQAKKMNEKNHKLRAKLKLWMGTGQ